jgi:ATPase subunit of ABC transporter with duplicated ATPase domains
LNLQHTLSLCHEHPFLLTSPPPPNLALSLSLARLLLSDPELLVLDEPTNHLDASARQWLGEYVGGYAGTVLIVSHDEGFISAAADSIAEVGR